MLDKKMLARYAIWDTALSCAMRRALGLPLLPIHMRKKPKKHKRIIASKSEIMECFSNLESPMNGRLDNV